MTASSTSIMNNTETVIDNQIAYDDYIRQNYNNSEMGNYTYYYDPNMPLSWEEQFLNILWTYITPIAFALITLVGTIGNSLVIYVILAKKQMRTSTNLMLLNLAVADISFLLVCAPFTAYKYAAFTWPFGNLWCKVVKYFLYMTAYVTVYTLVCISLLRYLTVVCSVASAKYRTKTNVIRCIIAIWLLMLSVNIPVILVHRVKTYNAYSYCGMVDSATAPFFFSFFVFAYVLPLLAICILYLLIMRHLNANKSANVGASANERTSRVWKVVVVVVAVFGLTWLPSHVNSILAYYGKTPNWTYYEVFRILWNCLVYGNSCANPIIYNYVSTEFKKSFREIFQCGKFFPKCVAKPHKKHDAVLVKGASKSEMTTMIDKVANNHATDDEMK